MFDPNALGKNVMSDPAIRTENLTRDFATVRAVDRLSLEVPRGAVFGFLGPNGAGKTTTIRLLLGLLEPTAGRAQVLGFDVRSQGQEVRWRTGALLEYPGLYDRLSAEDNLEFYGRIWHMPAAERRSRIEDLLQEVGLWDRRKERVETWSRGMRQKLAMARALLHRPSLVFLDEPTSGLDPIAAAALRDNLAALAKREGVTVFLTTHNLAEAEKLCDIVAVINAGKLVAVGSPAELQARASAPRVEIAGRDIDEDILQALRGRPEVAAVDFGDGRLIIDLNGDAEVAPLISLIVNRGGQVEEVRKAQATLEDVFLTLMQEQEQEQE